MYEGSIVIRYTGWSMYPTFFPHDLLTCRATSVHSLHRGDIVVVRSKKSIPEHMTVHRVCEIKEGKIITRGDNTDRPDEDPVTPDNFVGVVVRAKRREKEFPVRSGGTGYARHYLLILKKALFKSTGPVILQLEKLGDVRQPMKHLIPRIVPGKIIGIRTPGGIDLQLFFHNILIGWLLFNGPSWYIRPIFRPFVDSHSLPESYRSVFPGFNPDGGEFI